MTDQLQRTPRLTSIRLTAEESTVLLGLLQLSRPHGPTSLAGLSDRMVEKIHERLEATVAGAIDTGDGAWSTAEVDALRLGRLLDAALTDVADIVDRLEGETRADDRPVILMGSAGVASRALAHRIDALGVAPIIELDRRPRRRREG